MDTPKITVVGTASRWAPADHADVGFTVSRRDTYSGAAAAEAGRAYGALVAALAPHGAVIERRTTESLRVQEIVRYEQKSGRRIREGFEAARRLTVRFSPVAGAGDALRAALAAVNELQVDGPAFGLRPDNPVHAEVRAAAADQARSSAAAYASGLGLTLGAVVQLREPGSGEPVYVPGPAQRMFSQVARGGAGDEEVGEAVLVDLTDEDVAVDAAIELVIALVER